MKYDDMPKLVCVAEEEDWLSVNYAEEAFTETPQSEALAGEERGLEIDAPKTGLDAAPESAALPSENAAVPEDPNLSERELQPRFIRRKRKNKKHHRKNLWKMVAAAVAGIAIFCGLLLADGGMQGVFDYAKQTYISVLTTEQTYLSVELPACTTVQSVEDGAVVFSGGRLVLNLQSGEVTEAANGTVVVQAGEDLQYRYTGLTDVMVSVSQQVQPQDILGKYENQARVEMFYRGKPVKNMLQENRTLVWNV